MQNYGRGLEPKGLKEPNPQPTLELPEVEQIEVRWSALDGQHQTFIDLRGKMTVRYDADGKRLIIERAP